MTPLRLPSNAGGRGRKDFLSLGSFVDESLRACVRVKKMECAFRYVPFG